MSSIIRVGALASLLFVTALAPIAAQTAADEYPPAGPTPLSDSAMKLNREGLWAQAAELAVKGVRETDSQDERCGLMYSSIYALIRQGELDAGRAVIRTYDMQCTPLPSSRRYANGLEILRVEGSMPPVPSTGLDFSGVDKFWTVVDTLSKDVEPSSHLWRTLLATPGYRMALRTNDGLERQIDIAFKPSRRAERDSLVRAGGPDSAVLAHLIDAGEHRADLMAEQATLERVLPDTILAAVRNATAGLPPQTIDRVQPPFVAFALFGNSDFSQREGVVLDLTAATDTDLTALLSREFRRVYEADLAEPETAHRGIPRDTSSTGGVSGAREKAR